MSVRVEERKQNIEAQLKVLAGGSLRDGATALWNALGYHSKRTVEGDSVPEFVELTEGVGDAFREDKAQVDNKDRIGGISPLFQIADDDIQAGLNPGGTRTLTFETDLDATRFNSYLFVAVEVTGTEPLSRSDLARISREINRPFLMPVLTLFRQLKWQGPEAKKPTPRLTLTVQDRRANKVNDDRDVLEKVTVIKDIDLMDPHRAHLEILSDLSLPGLNGEHGFSDFGGLHAAWRKTLDTDKLSGRFYRELANWYFWACGACAPGADTTASVVLPRSIQALTEGKERQEQTSLFFIRLLTRLLFCWFLREKGLIPGELFRKRDVERLLKDTSPESGDYYRAVLQNLFFATLNQNVHERRWSKGKSDRGKGGVWRYADALEEKGGVKRLESLLRDRIPFVNGGLFECLDTVLDGDRENFRYDDFSGEKGNGLRLPLCLFFGGAESADLSAVYNDQKRGNEKVSGLLDVFSRFKFTVEENTPVEEEVALDPELLGKVFENLLASYNPETATTARKKTGSFYTPRAIVDYMVDEALIAYLNTETKVPTERLRRVATYSADDGDLTDDECKAVVSALDRVKILDPACGSGAFPMGALQKMVYLLRKLDPENAHWRKLQEARAVAETAEAFAIGDKLEREQRLMEIDNTFEANLSDYGRKLYLIQNAIYGVDIQPIAVQIAKLRFFISLVIEQTPDFDDQKNFGIAPLPNLETKIVAANALIPVKRPNVQLNLMQESEVGEIERELAKTRRRYFEARTPETKRKRKDEDEALRKRLVEALKQEGWPAADAERVAAWNPYAQESHADFFDPEWMFGLPGDTGVFDIVIANPPYVRQEDIKEQKPALKAAYPDVYNGIADLYTYFYALAIRLLKPGGTLSFISSNKWFRAGYGENLRRQVAATCQIENIVDFGDLAVFETAIAYPLVFIARKGKPVHAPRFTRVSSLAPPYPDVHAITTQSGFTLPDNAIQGATWSIADGDTNERQRVLRAAGKPLGEYVNQQIYYGIKTGLNEAFIIDDETRAVLIEEDARSAEIIKPMAAGRDIKRWVVANRNQWLIFTRRGINIDDYPAVKDHLSQWHEELTPKQKDPSGNTSLVGRKPGTYKWYEIQDEVAYNRFFDGPKIMYQEIAMYQSFAFDDGGLYVNNKVFIIPTEDLYLLAILNSAPVWSFLSEICPKMVGGAFAMQKPYVEQIPIPDAPASDRDSITALVQACLDKKGVGVAQVEAEINERVAKLYGL